MSAGSSCAKSIGSGYQCDGDAGGKTQGAQKYRVMTNDLNIVIADWKKKDAELPANLSESGWLLFVCTSRATISTVYAA